MNPLNLAQEIIDGRRITREDDLSFFLTCDLDELCEGADRIREACIGDKVDLCSIINGRIRKLQRKLRLQQLRKLQRQLPIIQILLLKLQMETRSILIT